MKKKGIIELRNLRFKAYHGCLPQERIEGADYLVNLRCEADLRRAASSDSLEHTVDYSMLYDIIKNEMATPANLLERVAGNILKNIRYYAPAVKSATITICKMEPPFNYAENALDLQQTAACVTLGF